MNMRGVVMMVNELPPLPVGGAERQAERLAAYLVRNNWSVWIVTRGAAGLPSVEERNGYTIIRPLTFGHGKLRTITFMLFATIALIRMRSHYGLLHAHLAFGPSFVAILVGRLLGKRVVVKLGNSGSIGDVNTSMKTLRGHLRFAAIKRWADIVIVLSDAMRAEALSIGIPQERLRKFNNGIDASLYLPNRTKAEAKRSLGLDGKTIVLFVGRLDPIKSVHTALDALSLSLDKLPDLYLIIVGDGPEMDSLVRRTRELDIVSSVAFMGIQQEVRPYLEMADLFVLPSKAEGISNALLEAMSAQIACLAAPVGGNPEVLINEKYGLLVPHGDVNAWVDAILKISSNLELRTKMGMSARERILEEYDFTVVGKKYENLYIELLSRKQLPINKELENG